MELRTARLLLRPFRAGDHPDLSAIFSDPEMHWLDPEIRSPEGTAVFLDHALAMETREPRSGWKFAVVRAADNVLLGSTELLVETPEHRRGTMGYLIAPAAQGHGYATEAARAVLEFAFTGGGLHRVWATCDPGNAGSIRVLEKAGMTREGHLRDHYLIGGEWHDRLLFAALAPQAQLR